MGETKAEYEVAYGSAAGRAARERVRAGSWRREREREQQEEHCVQAAGAGVRAAENRRGRSCGCVGQGGRGAGRCG
jgi:hypothetical protein